jgi:cytochrome P450
MINKRTKRPLLIFLNSIKGLLVGGHGTTTDTLCVSTNFHIFNEFANKFQYIFMLLSKSPDVVEKLREEHARVFHSDFGETLNILRESPQKLNDLEYTNAVIQETLRLFPVGFGVREAEEGYFLSDQYVIILLTTDNSSTLTVNGDTLPIDNHLAVIAAQHVLHYDPKYYPEPAKFNPERFMDPDNTVARSCFRTFGRGPRACLGQNLAKIELKVILLMTVRDYTFECVDLKPNKTPRTTFTDMDTVFGDIVFQELGLEAKPRGGMMMTVQKISH